MVRLFFIGGSESFQKKLPVWPWPYFWLCFLFLSWSSSWLWLFLLISTYSPTRSSTWQPTQEYCKDTQKDRLLYYQHLISEMCSSFPTSPFLAVWSPGSVLCQARERKVMQKQILVVLQSFIFYRLFPSCTLSFIPMSQDGLRLAGREESMIRSPKSMTWA